MKKVFLLIIMVICTSLFLIFNHSIDDSLNVKTYYNVYFNGDNIGVVKSEDELLSYIEKQQDVIKKQYNTEKIYTPNEISIQKVVGYNEHVDNVNNIYNTINQLSNFTIDGYQITIQNDFDYRKLYVTTREIFDEAVENVIKIFVGEERYLDYKNNNQKEISDTGSYINNIYLDNKITIQEMKISIKERIYTTADEVVQYLMYGESIHQK